MRTRMPILALVVFVGVTLGSSVCQSAAQSAEERSVNELAKELANPNTVLTSLKFKLQYRSFKGNLPGADSQNMTQILFQPTLPFPLEHGHTLWIRPGTSFIFDQPVFDSAGLESSSEIGLSDTTLDFQYGDTLDNGFLWSVGATVTLPTATADGLGADLWAAGPGFQLGLVTEKSVLGFFLNQQWDFAGSGESGIDLATLQIFAVFLPGGGWTVGSVPIMSYNHINESWTVPLNLGISKTVKINGRPWKFGVEVNYFVEQPDSFGPEWMIGFNVAPVVKNAVYDWVQDKD